MAWLLGYIWADGSIGEYDSLNGSKGYVLQFGCAIDDRELIDQIYEMLDCHQKIAYRKSQYRSIRGEKSYKSKPSVSLQIGRKELVQSLIKLGVRPRKSELNLPFPVIPDEMLSNFVRGYFDGDGYAYAGINQNGYKRVQVALCGPFNFLYELQELMVRILKINKHKVCECGRSFKISWEGRKDVKLLFSWLYPEPNLLCLERKRLRISKIF